LDDLQVWQGMPLPPVERLAQLRAKPKNPWIYPSEVSSAPAITPRQNFDGACPQDNPRPADSLTNTTLGTTMIDRRTHCCSFLAALILGMGCEKDTHSKVQSATVDFENIAENAQETWSGQDENPHVDVSTTDGNAPALPETEPGEVPSMAELSASGKFHTGESIAALWSNAFAIQPSELFKLEQHVILGTATMTRNDPGSYNATPQTKLSLNYLRTLRVVAAKQCADLIKKPSFNSQGENLSEPELNALLTQVSGIQDAEYVAAIVAAYREGYKAQPNTPDESLLKLYACVTLMTHPSLFVY
jgi:hypothetical protein